MLQLRHYSFRQRPDKAIRIAMRARRVPIVQYRLACRELVLKVSTEFPRVFTGSLKAIALQGF